jgi:hypothetical protein
MGCGCGRKVKTNAVKQVTKNVSGTRTNVPVITTTRRRVIKRPAR